MDEDLRDLRNGLQEDLKVFLDHYKLKDILFVYKDANALVEINVKNSDTASDVAREDLQKNLVKSFGMYQLELSRTRYYDGGYLVTTEVKKGDT